MPRRHAKPSTPPPAPASQAAWEEQALAILEKATGSRVTTMRSKEWTRLYVAGATPEAAAKMAEKGHSLAALLRSGRSSPDWLQFGGQ